MDLEAEEKNKRMKQRRRINEYEHSRKENNSGRSITYK